MFVPAKTGEVDEYPTLKKRTHDRLAATAIAAAAADGNALSAVDCGPLAVSVNQYLKIRRHVDTAGLRPDAPTFRLPIGVPKTVGRAPGADFIVKAGLVSRLHCRLTASEEQLEVEDLKEAPTGTFVNEVEGPPRKRGSPCGSGRVELTVERQK